MAPRPNSDGTVQVQVRVPKHVADRLKDEAAKRIVGQSVLAAFLLEDGLSRLVPVGELMATGPTETPQPSRGFEHLPETAAGEADPC